MIKVSFNTEQSTSENIPLHMETKFLATSRDIWPNKEYHKWVTIDSETGQEKDKNIPEYYSDCWVVQKLIYVFQKTNKNPQKHADQLHKTSGLLEVI